MKIVEMIGLPGCGKSTVSDYVIDVLKKDGLKVANRQDIYFKDCHGHNKTRILTKAILKFRNYRLYFLVLRLNRKCSSKLRDLKYVFQWILLIYQLQKIEKQNYDMIVLDEGVIQYLSSQSFDQEFKNGEIIKNIVEQLQKLVPEIAFINCKIDITLSIERLYLRADISRRFSKNMSREELYSVLECKESNINMINKFVDIALELNMEKKVEDNGMIMLQFINRR